MEFPIGRLLPGGVFWGVAVDARHPFALASTLLAKLRMKDLYLNWLHGERGSNRYENFPIFYRANTVWLRQACMNRFEGSVIVGCQSTILWRTADEHQKYTRASDESTIQQGASDVGD